MTSRHQFLILWAALAVMTRPGRAQVTVDPVTTTGVSGYSSTKVNWLTAGMSGSGLSTIQWQEAADKPCFMTVSRRDLSGNGAGINGVSDMLDGCGASSSIKTVSFGSSPRYVIRGVAVCTNNNDNHRLKGIRIYAAKVWTTKEEVESLTVSDEASRTNCATWHPPVYCPSGNVASGIVVHHTDENTIEITGLSLRCKRVEY